MNTLNDSLDDLLGGERRATTVTPPAQYAAVQASYTEPCKKCRGTGTYSRFGQCFACKGAGKFTFKTSPETRAASRASANARKDAAATAALAGFEAQHPLVWGWIKANAQKFDFATKMVEAIVRFGNLTEGQLAACQRMLDKETARAAERAQEAHNAPTVDTAGVDRLKLAFDTAIAYAAAKGRGLRTPKITIGNVVVSPAKESSANAGALYVKMAGTYLGKIVAGRFFASRDCNEAQKATVLAFVADPKAAAEAYGIETGVCCICNAQLTNKESIERGIGPICAEKFGW